MNPRIVALTFGAALVVTLSACSSTSAPTVAGTTPAVTDVATATPTPTTTETPTSTSTSTANPAGTGTGTGVSKAAACATIDQRVEALANDPAAVAASNAWAALYTGGEATEEELAAFRAAYGQLANVYAGLRDLLNQLANQVTDQQFATTLRNAANAFSSALTAFNAVSTATTVDAADAAAIAVGTALNNASVSLGPVGTACGF